MTMIWDAIPQKPEVERLERLTSALRRASAALMDTRDFAMQADSQSGFEARVAGAERRIDQVVAAAVLIDPGTHPIVRQALMEQWHADFQDVMRDRQHAQQMQHARRAARRSEQRRVAKTGASYQTLSDGLSGRYGPGKDRALREIDRAQFDDDESYWKRVYNQAVYYTDWAHDSSQDGRTAAMIEKSVDEGAEPYPWGRTYYQCSQCGYPFETAECTNPMCRESKSPERVQELDARAQAYQDEQERIRQRNRMWEQSFRPRSSMRTRASIEAALNKLAGSLADALQGLDVGGTLALGSGKIVRQSNGWDVVWDDGYTHHVGGDYATVAANYYLNADLAWRLDRKAASKTAADDQMAQQHTVVFRFLDKTPDGKFDLSGRQVGECPYCGKTIESSGYMNAGPNDLAKHVSLEHNISAPLLPPSHGAKTAAGRLKIDDRGSHFTLIYMAPEDAPGYGVWEDVLSRQYKDEIWAWLDNPTWDFGDTQAIANFKMTGSKEAAWDGTDWESSVVPISLYPGLTESAVVHVTYQSGGFAQVFQSPDGKWLWTAGGRDNAEGNGDAPTRENAMVAAEAFLDDHDQIEGQVSLFASVIGSLLGTKMSSQVHRYRGRTAALTVVKHAGMFHWAVTDESGDDEKDSGSGKSVRDVLETAWDALNKVLDHEPPPADNIAKQVEQAADATGEAVQNAGGSAPDDGDPTGGTKGDAPPADGDKTSAPAKSDDSGDTNQGDSKSSDSPPPPKGGDAAQADPTTKADAGDPDGKPKSDNAPEGGDDKAAPKDAPPSNGDAASKDDSADSGAEKGTAPTPESASDEGSNPASDVPPSPADTSTTPTSDAVVDSAEMGGNVQGIDPKSMTTGQQINMTYTLNDGTTGNVDVTFVRENNEVYFFDGPKGEFGIGDRDGMWVDSEGNQFAFSDGDAMEEVIGEDLPEDAVIEEVDLDQPIDQAGAPDDDSGDTIAGTPIGDEDAADDGKIETDPQDQPSPEQKTEDADKKSDDDDDDDFKKRFESALRSMRSENLGIPEARLQTLARRAAKLSYAVEGKFQ